MKVDYTKKWQLVAMFYQEPFRYFPSKVLKLGIIKIKTYPQELPEGEEREVKKNYKGFLFNLSFRYPKIMFKGQMHLSFRLNDAESVNRFGWLKFLRKKPTIKKVPIDNEASIDALVKQSLEQEQTQEPVVKKKPTKKKPTKKKSTKKKAVKK